MGRHSDSLFDWMSYFGSSRKLIPLKIENDVPYWNPFPFSGGLIFRRGAELMAIILPLFSCYGIHPNLSEQKYCKIQKMQTWVVLASNTDFFFYLFICIQVDDSKLLCWQGFRICTHNYLWRQLCSRMGVIFFRGIRAIYRCELPKRCNLGKLGSRLKWMFLNVFWNLRNEEKILKTLIYLNFLSYFPIFSRAREIQYCTTKIFYKIIYSIDQKNSFELLCNCRKCLHTFIYVLKFKITCMHYWSKTIWILQICKHLCVCRLHTIALQEESIVYDYFI